MINQQPQQNLQNQQQQQKSNIRNFPPSQQPQYRQGPPLGVQQGYQQAPRQAFVTQPPPQRPAVVPEQKVPLQKTYQSYPQQQPQQQASMMAEMSREKTFTTGSNNNNNNGNISNEHSMSMDDDDDDVVVGRMNTPQSKNGQKSVESHDTRPMSGKENIQPQMRTQPAASHQVVSSPQPVQQPADIKRRESVQSIPSRPPSGLGSNNSVSPEQRMSPNPPIQQQHQQYRPPSQADNHQLNRQPHDYVRDMIDHERGQRPPSAHQRQSPEDMNIPKIPPSTQSQLPQHHQSSPPPVQMPSQSIKQQLPMKQPQQQNIHRPNQDSHMQPSIQDHLPFMKPNLIGTTPMAQKIPEKKVEIENLTNGIDEKKNAINLDLERKSSVKGNMKDRMHSKFWSGRASLLY